MTSRPHRPLNFFMNKLLDDVETLYIIDDNATTPSLKTLRSSFHDVPARQPIRCESRRKLMTPQQHHTTSRDNPFPPVCSSCGSIVLRAEKEKNQPEKENMIMIPKSPIQLHKKVTWSTTDTTSRLSASAESSSSSSPRCGGVKGRFLPPLSPKSARWSPQGTSLLYSRRRRERSGQNHHQQQQKLSSSKSPSSSSSATRRHTHKTARVETAVDN